MCEWATDYGGSKGSEKDEEGRREEEAWVSRICVRRRVCMGHAWRVVVVRSQ